MRIVHLVPGTGNFFCGGSLRDELLVEGVKNDFGHEMLMVPLYLPLVLEREGKGDGPVFLGALNMYLQQKSGLFRRSPEWVDRGLDTGPLLRLVAERADLTRARDLEEMMEGSFEATQGDQAKEWLRLLDWIEMRGRPDVVSLSNGLFTGFARAIREQLKVPVVVHLQGEAVFLDTLIEPYRSRCWEAFRNCADAVSRFVAVSESYAGQMKGRLREETGDKIRVVHNGVDSSSFKPQRAAPEDPVIGFLARLSHGKGLQELVRAFVRLKKEGSVPDLKLKLGGSMTRQDAAFVDTVKEEVQAAGVEADVSWHPNLDPAEKREFLRSISVLSVPALYDEAFGLYLIEAMACGVPVVQPDRGAFREIVDCTGGGVIVGEGEADLALGLEEVLLDEEKRMALGKRGRCAVETRFTRRTMARGFLDSVDEALAELNPLERR